MKRIIILLALFITIGFTNNSFAQRRGRGGSTIKWLSLAAKGSYGISFLMNKETYADPNVFVVINSPAYSYGGRFGLTFGDYIGITGEYMLGSISQIYDIYDPNNNNEKYTRNTKLQYSAWDIMLRYTSDFGFYFMAGPMFNTIKSVSQTTSITLPDPTHDSNIANKFVQEYTSLVVDLGLMPVRTERLTLSVGLRLNYGLDNIMADNTYFSAVDGIYTPDPMYTNSEITPISTQIMVELNYFFAFWGDASCGRGRFMIFQ